LYLDNSAEHVHLPLYFGESEQKEASVRAAWPPSTRSWPAGSGGWAAAPVVAHRDLRADIVLLSDGQIAAAGRRQTAGGEVPARLLPLEAKYPRLAAGWADGAATRLRQDVPAALAIFAVDRRGAAPPHPARRRAGPLPRGRAPEALFPRRAVCTPLSSEEVAAVCGAGEGACCVRRTPSPGGPSAHLSPREEVAAVCGGGEGACCVHRTPLPGRAVCTPLSGKRSRAVLRRRVRARVASSYSLPGGPSAHLFPEEVAAVCGGG
jgi:hypothetical protein